MVKNGIGTLSDTYAANPNDWWSHPAPGIDDTKEGEVVEAYLQKQKKSIGESEWINTENNIKPSQFTSTRQIWVAANQEAKEEQPWIEISENNLPSDLLICEWLHPEYGIIKGNLIWDGGKLESEKSWWIFPVGGADADIALSEFTHYRKPAKKAQSPSAPKGRSGFGGNT